MRTRIWPLVGSLGAGLSLSLCAAACNVFGDIPPDQDGGPEGSIPEVAPIEGSSSGAGDATIDSADGGPADGAQRDSVPDWGAESSVVMFGDGSTAPWWPYTTEAGCMSEGMPKPSDRPAVPDSDSGAPIYLAFSNLFLGTASYDFTTTPPTITANSNAWQDLGMDIDGRCTNSPTCKTSNGRPITELACFNPNLTPYDGNLCRDNIIGKLYGIGSMAPDLSNYFGFTEEDANCELKRGGEGTILKISYYNGELNDPQVRLDMYSSLGLVTRPRWTCRATPSDKIDPAWPSQADWLSTYPWIVAQQSISLAATITGPELPESNNDDPTAYVRNGYLVAQMADPSAFWFPGDNTGARTPRIIIHRGALIAKLEKAPDDTWVVNDGVVVYVTLPHDLLLSFREIGYCENMCQQYQVVKSYINTNLDALSNSDQWFPTTPCDGLSAGIGFRARQATALAGDIRPAIDPVECPNPLNPNGPKQGCDCDAGGGQCLVDAAASPMDAGTDASDASGRDSAGGG
jgi:hypothetical protein